MTSTTYLMRQFCTVLSDMTHPIEGTVYLFLIALIVRWAWPITWNHFLERVSAPVRPNSKTEGSDKADK